MIPVSCVTYVFSLFSNMSSLNQLTPNSASSSAELPEPNRPPKKWRPLKCAAHILGAVKEINNPAAGASWTI